jgi:alpha-tubulin suppressor-like RCC1 family protein
MEMVLVSSSHALSQMVPNKWGIPEPPLKNTIANDSISSRSTTPTLRKATLATPPDIDAIVVPGVAFDAFGGRCGHGMGYYDRFIAGVIAARSRQKLPPPLLIGVALAEQIVENVPMDDHDFHMDMIIAAWGTVFDSSAAMNEPMSATTLQIHPNHHHQQQHGDSSAAHQNASLLFRTLWVEIENEHEHSMRGRHQHFAKPAATAAWEVARSSSSPAGPSTTHNNNSNKTNNTWKDRLNHLSARGIKTGWRVMPPPIIRQRESDSLFNERFRWMSSRKKTKSKKHSSNMQGGLATSDGGSDIRLLRSGASTQSTWMSWGSGGSGVLAHSTFNDAWQPHGTTLGGGGQPLPKDVAIGGNHIVSWNADGTRLAVWGKNGYGQLGKGCVSSESTHAPQHHSLPFPDPVASSAAAVAASGTATTTTRATTERIGISLPADAMDAGLDSQHEESPSWQQTLLPHAGILPRSPFHVLQVACGWNHTVVLTANGEMWGWGSNARGQLGLIGMPNVNSPRSITVSTSLAHAEDTATTTTTVEARRPIIGVAAGGSHSLFLFGNGDIFGCGDNRYMQLGSVHVADSSTKSESVVMVVSPRRVPWTSTHMPISVACGWQFSAARTHGGLVYTWGDNRRGQCAQQYVDSAGAVVSAPTRVQFGPEKNNVCITSISCGWSHMLAMERSGNVYSWGRSDMGQLGVTIKPPLTGSTGVFEVDFPQFRPPDARVVKIACGSEHSMAVTSGGDLFTWGWGEHGNLGHGVNSNERTPRRVAEFGNKNGCYVQNVVAGGAAVFVHVLRHVFL